jgi:acylphosphatase
MFVLLSARHAAQDTLFIPRLKAGVEIDKRLVMRRFHFFVSGKVQGVFYRQSVAGKAQALGLKGFVRNLLGGRVEVLAEGPEAELKEFLLFCKSNPGNSSVASIKFVDDKTIKQPIKDESFQVL